METPDLIVSNNKPARLWLRPLALAAALLVLLALALLLHWGDKLLALKSWFESLGSWGPLTFVGIYVVADVAMVPATLLTVAAGAIFGPVVGVACISAGATLAAAVCFLISRYVARQAVVNWLAGNAKFQRVEELTRRHGGWVVALIRLVPLFPFNLVNYAFGLTAIGFWTYLFSSWLCMFPAIILYVVGADAVLKTYAQGKVPWELVGVLAVTALALVPLMRHVKRKIEWH